MYKHIYYGQQMEGIWISKSATRLLKGDHIARNRYHDFKFVLLYDIMSESTTSIRTVNLEIRSTED